MYATEPVATATAFVKTDAEKQSEKTNKTMGVVAADCKKCHPAEVATWMKTVHFQSPDLRLF